MVNSVKDAAMRCIASVQLLLLILLQFALADSLLTCILALYAIPFDTAASTHKHTSMNFMRRRFSAFDEDPTNLLWCVCDYVGCVCASLSSSSSQRASERMNASQANVAASLFVSFPLCLYFIERRALCARLLLWPHSLALKLNNMLRRIVIVGGGGGGNDNSGNNNRRSSNSSRQYNFQRDHTQRWKKWSSLGLVCLLMSSRLVRL